MQEFVEINNQINTYMDQRNHDGSVALMIDIVSTEYVPQELSRMKASQTYPNRSDIKWLSDENNLNAILMQSINQIESFKHIAP